MACLITCRSCERLHARSESSCPFCGAQGAGGAVRRGSLFAAVAMGLSLAGCVDDGESMTSSGTTAGTSMGTTEADTVESDSAGEATYGVPMDDTSTGIGDSWEGTSSSSGTSGGDTDTDTEGDTDTDTDTDGGSSSSSSSG